MAYPTVGTFSTYGYQNVYIPGYMGDDQAQKRLMIGFTLNEEEFDLNKYITVHGAKEPKFYYIRWNSADFVRVPQTDGSDMRWADGADRPETIEGPRFTNEPVELRNYGLQDKIGNLAIQFSQIGDLLQISQDTMATRFMIQRALYAQRELTTSTNYPSTHYYATYNALSTTAAALGYAAGYFGTPGTDNLASGTINDPLLGKVLKHAVLTILRKSNGRVKPKDLLLVMNPNTANRLANSQEIRAYMAQQVGSKAVLEGKDPATWPEFGLPNPLYGLKVVIDATTYSSGKPDRANLDTTTFTWADGLIAVVARPGAVVPMKGSIPTGSLTLWQHEKLAMRPMTEPDPFHQRVKVGFQDFVEVKLTAPEITWTMSGCFTA